MGHEFFIGSNCHLAPSARFAPSGNAVPSGDKTDGSCRQAVREGLGDVGDEALCNMKLWSACPVGSWGLGEHARRNKL